METEWRVLVEQRGAEHVSEIITGYEPEADAGYWAWAVQGYKELAWRNLPYHPYRYNLPGLPEVMEIAGEASRAASEADHLWLLSGNGFRRGYTTVTADLFASPALAAQATPTWSDPDQTRAILRALALYAAQCAAVIEDRVRTLRTSVERRRNVPGWEKGELLPPERG